MEVLGVPVTFRTATVPLGLFALTPTARGTFRTLGSLLISFLFLP